jgi:Zn-dependent peptidase ImmA (M78 family)
VNPEILRWARETAGLSVGDAADRIALGAAGGLSAAARLAAMESGEESPSRPLLLRMAKQYRQPLLTFYLARPPRLDDRGQDFRTLPDVTDPEDEFLLDVLLRDMRARQDLIRAAIEDEEDVTPLRFVGSAALSDDVEGVLFSIRQTLGLSRSDLRHEPNADAVFSLLRSKVEQLGVFVILAGDLGSHHSAIPVETFRGIALSDAIAPFIVINDRDSRAAWSFSLLHELVHIWLGQTGVSGGEPSAGVERFCNDVASEFLLPSSELTRLRLRPGTLEEQAETLTQFARERNVSSSMVAYRLFRSGAIGHGLWTSLARFYRDRWFRNRTEQRIRATGRTGGPSYYVVRRHRLGPALLETTDRLLVSGTMTTTRAATVLGVKPKQVQSLIGR